MFLPGCWSALQELLVLWLHSIGDSTGRHALLIGSNDIGAAPAYQGTMATGQQRHRHHWQQSGPGINVALGSHGHGKLTSYWIEQTGLGLYIGNMIKSMKGASKALEARLELAGHANVFPSAPVVATKEWDLLQLTIIVL